MERSVLSTNLKDGLWTCWFGNGQKKKEVNWKDGKLITAVGLKPNGEKCPVTNVVDGNGPWVYYNEEGPVAA
jgi:antitoxin component YwqK of YwqJK toxin-antitoxin module